MSIPPTAPGHGAAPGPSAADPYAPPGRYPATGTYPATAGWGPPPAPAAPAVPGTYAYHRLQRTRPGARWWRPVLVGLVAAALYVALIVAGLVVAVVAGEVWGTGGWELLERLDAMDMRDPASFAVLMYVVVAMLPAVVVATRLLGARPVGLLASVAGRVRWSWAARCLALSLTITALLTAVEAAVVVLGGGTWTPRVDPATWPLLVLVAMLVPFQCVAEEVVFRGWMAQTLGAWLRHPAFAVLLPVPLFVVAHAYVGLGMLDTAVWAVAMGWLVWRTGGLEAAAAEHVVNNVVVFGLGAFGLVDLDAVDMAPDAFAVSTVSTVLYVVGVEVLARRTGLERVRVVPEPDAAPALGVPAPAAAHAPATTPAAPPSRSGPQGPDGPWAPPSARP